MIVVIYNSKYDLTYFNHPFAIDIKKYLNNLSLTTFIEKTHPHFTKKYIETVLKKYKIN